MLSCREPIGPVIGRSLLLGDYCAAAYAILMGRSAEQEQGGRSVIDYLEGTTNGDRFDGGGEEGGGERGDTAIGGGCGREVLDVELDEEGEGDDTSHCGAYRDHCVWLAACLLLHDYMYLVLCTAAEDDSPLAQARGMFLTGCSLRDVLRHFPSRHVRERALLKQLIRHRPVQSSTDSHDG